MAEAGVRQVVLLQSFERGNLVLDRFTSLLRAAVDERSPEAVTFTEFVVSPASFGDIPEPAFVSYIQSAFGGRMPDLVITAGGPASAFARRHPELFAESPRVYAAVDVRFFRNAELNERETAVTVANDPRILFDDIARLFPGTANVFVITGAGEHGRFWRQELERDAKQLGGRFRLLWSDGMSYAQVLQYSATLPPRSAVLFVTLEVDAQGVRYPTERSLRDLRRRSNAPLFAAQTTGLGNGVVGGTLMAIDDTSRHAADAALQILGGTKPALVTTPVQRPGPPTFDWRELQRWGVSENRLPAGSVVLFREPTIWQRYGGIIAGGAVALIAQTVLIAALMTNRSRLQVARASLSSLNRRLIETQEHERSRVAKELHDDVCQRIAMLAFDVERLGKTIPPGDQRMRQDLDRLAENVRTVTADITSISHGLHSTKLECLGLAAAAKTFCREVSAHHGIDVEFAGEDIPAPLPEAIAINVFRVLQEALTNAVRHSGASRIRVSLRRAGDDLQLEVADAGRGFETAAAMATGLGLIGMQERVRLLDGQLAITSAPGAGTTARAVVPLPPRA